VSEVLHYEHSDESQGVAAFETGNELGTLLLKLAAFGAVK